MKTNFRFASLNKPLLLTLLLGFFLRLALIGNIPGNGSMYADELFSGYEAFSMLRYGFDAYGYHNPVYLPAWGSGQSAMQAWLIMPVMAVFGVNSFSVRLPSAILGCLSLLAFYGLCKRIRGERFALIATFVFAVMPWHIMMSRWALDCNMLHHFVLFAFYFLVRATQDPRWLVPSLFTFGLSLYCYAAAWPVMPLVVFGSLAYLLATKQLRPTKWLALSVALLALLAVPLFLFLLVNMDILPEIRTSFFSVPRLHYFRSSEFSASPRVLLKRLAVTLQMFLTQDDGRLSDVTPDFGLYYKFSWPLILLGAAMCLYDRTKTKEHPKEGLLLIWFGAASLLSFLIEVYFSRINLIHIPIVYFLAVGVYVLIERFGERATYFFVTVYLVSVVAFGSYYATIHDDALAKAYADGTEDAIRYAEEVRPKDGTIYLANITHIRAMFYAPVPTDEYVETVVYADYKTDLVPLRFTHYDFSYSLKTGEEKADPSSMPVGPSEVYIVAHESNEILMRYLEENGYQFRYFNGAAVGVCEGQ